MLSNMKVRLKQFGALNFEARADSGHRVVMAASPEVGGEGAGPRPMEMVLMGLGGCSGIDVALILRKSRQRVRDFEIDIEAERADAVPAVFTRIHVHYRFRGENLDPGKVARAVALSMEKYCSVTRMLERAATITHDFEIIAPDASAEGEPEPELNPELKPKRKPEPAAPAGEA